MQTRLILAVFSYLAVASLVQSQTATGVTRGTVQDSSCAILVHVRVRLTPACNDGEGA